MQIDVHLSTKAAWHMGVCCEHSEVTQWIPGEYSPSRSQ